MPKKEILNNDAVTLRVGETAADILEETSEVIEQTLDILESIPEKVVTVTKNNPWLIAGALLLGAGIGAAITYKIVEKRLGDKFDRELDEQMEATREWRHRIAKEGVFESPESAVKAIIPEGEVADVVQQYRGREKPIPYNDPSKIVTDPRPPVETVVEKVEAVTQNVFVEAQKATSVRNGPLDWDEDAMRAEIADRELHPDKPYAISFEEYNENHPNHEQTTLMYYVQDDTLVDAQDKPIDDTEYAVGDDNLTRFGHGSHDPNVVYVRNEKIDMDFEIVRDMGSYHKALFGTDPNPSLQHSRRTNRRRGREDE